MMHLFLVFFLLNVIFLLRLSLFAGRTVCCCGNRFQWCCCLLLLCIGIILELPYIRTTYNTRQILHVYVRPVVAVSDIYIIYFQNYYYYPWYITDHIIV